ncbi:hypothetical protein, partial [Hoylesella timonensis]
YSELQNYMPIPIDFLLSLFYLYCWLFFSSPRDADNLSLRFENVCISRRGLLFYCTSFWNLHGN